MPDETNRGYDEKINVHDARARELRRTRNLRDEYQVKLANPIPESQREEQLRKVRELSKQKQTRE